MAHDDPFAGKRVHADWAFYLDTAGTYTPTLTAVTNPTLGTGATQSGWWQRNGHLITGGAIIRFGSSGADPGSGAYLVSLPFDADVSTLTASASFGVATILGTCSLRDNSAVASSRTATSYLATASAARMQIADNSTVTDSAPWIWANDDAIAISFAYLADPAGLPS